MATPSYWFLKMKRPRWVIFSCVTITGLLFFWMVADIFATDRVNVPTAASGVAIKEEYLIAERTANNDTPRTSIFFLKTHKCGSSTVQNILLRYGDRNQLNFFLPTRGNYLGNKLPFQRSMVLHAPWRSLRPTVFCHHTVFNEREVRAIMPEDTVYLTIVRDPVDLFESLYSYSKLELHYKMDIEDFSKANFADKTYTNRASGYLGLNQMLYDSGFPPTMMGPRSARNENAVKDHVTALDRVFGLVLLAEKFDESMVLMRDFLRWDTKDMVYFSQNVRKADTKRNLTESSRRRLRELSWADELLYDYFKGKFDDLVGKFGEGEMKEEVRKLRQMRDEYYNICVQKEGSGKELKLRFRLFSNQVQGYQLRRDQENNRTCETLAMSEMAFTESLRVAQMARAFQMSPVEAAAKWIQMYPNFPNANRRLISNWGKKIRH